MFFVGIDWADQKHDVVVVDEKGDRVFQTSIEHNRKGLEQLQASLQRLSTVPEDFACVIETRNGLLVQFLLEITMPVYPVNPKVVNARRKASGAKTDRIDALLLADYGRADLPRLKRLTPHSGLIQELQLLTRDQDVLINEHSRIANRLSACLKEYYPVALNLFSDYTCKCSLDLLKEYPTLSQARKATKSTMADFLKQHRVSHASRKAEEILVAVNTPQLEADGAVVRAKSRFMLALIRQLETVQGDIASYEKEIERLFKSHSDHKIFSSLPGVGDRLGPRLLAEWGDDRERYPNAEAVQALAGTSPVMFQSGKYSKARRRRSCVKPFRHALQLMAFTCLTKCPWAKEYYDAKRASGSCHQAALRTLANRWVKIMFAMWMQRSLYNEDRFLGDRDKHNLAA